MEYKQNTTPSPKSKLRQTLCNYCCFRHHGHEITPSPPSSSDDDSPRLSRSLSTWLKPRNEFPELKFKCRHLLSRIVGHSRRHSSPIDFRYDPLSYAMNFDDGVEDGYVNAHPLRAFFVTFAGAGDGGGGGRSRETDPSKGDFMCVANEGKRVFREWRMSSNSCDNLPDDRVII